MQFTMSSPSYKNTNEMPIKQATMKIDKTKVKKSSKVSSKVEIMNIELQAMKKELQDKLFQKSALIKELNITLDASIDWRERLLFSEHHLSHAASAFYPSPFKEAS